MALALTPLELQEINDKCSAWGGKLEHRMKTEHKHCDDGQDSVEDIVDGHSVLCA